MHQPPTFSSGRKFVSLHVEGESVYCRGLYGSGAALSVLAVIPGSDPPPRGVLDRLRREFELKEALEPEWAAQPLELVQDEGRTVLLLKDPGGEFLAGLLGKPMDPGLFLRLGVGMAKSVARLHQAGLIHKDIKPSHVLLDRNSGAAWLTGFGIASRLPRERQAPEPPEKLAGSLPYMAPEQTGRMNRSIDARSDLYALGVTFYEMLAGETPFSAEDPIEWVHCHIARKAAAPAERIKAIPAPLSAIVMKLIAKDAEERYQTAAGLEKDLKHCLSEWEAEGSISEFQLGQHDIPDRLRIPEKLYGREREIELLLAAFGRVVKTGVPEFVLVSGYSGIGKSAVVHELHKALVPPRGLFASGKFDQYEGGIPYATLARAFARLIHPLLGRSEAELEPWRKALQEALSPNGKLIADLVPELRLIIGDQPPVPQLEPAQTKARFQLVFRRFLGVFARPEHPLALFIDDLQWLDMATLDMMEDLLIQEDVRHLLLIGAYRENEVSPAHPLMRKLDNIRKAGAVVHEIALAPLRLSDLTQLIANALHCKAKRAGPLAQLIQSKTAGNPFFATQFLSALAVEGLLAFDHGKGHWRWDLKRIQAKGYTDNVADLVATKLCRLPSNTEWAVQQLACLGNSARTPTIALVSETPEEEVHAVLEDALRQELVQRRNNSYGFAHDRVHEAAYALIPEELRAKAHLRIGRTLLAHTPKEKREDAVFEIVSQLNRGAALITSRKERGELAWLNLVAGKRAKASTAYPAALAYLSAGAALLAEDCWDRQHELAFGLEINWAECEFLTGELAAAERRLETLSSHATGSVERAGIACLRIDLYMTLAQTGRAVAAALDYLRYLGIGWLAHPSEEEARREYEQIWLNLGSRPIEELIDLPRMTDPASLATMDVLIKLAPPALFTDTNLHCLVACHAINLSIKHGNSDGSCAAYVRLGAIAGPHFGDYEAGSRFGQLAYELVEKRGLKRFQARTFMILGIYVMPWTKHVRAGRDLLRRAFETANQCGDLTYAGYSREVLITNLLVAGDPLGEVQRQAETGLAFTQKLHLGFTADVMTGQLGLIRTLRGLTPKFGCFDGEQFNEAQFEQHFSSNRDLALPEYRYWTRKLQALFMAGDYPAAVEALERAQPLLWTSRSFIEAADYHFYGALSRAAYCDSMAPGERRQHLEALASHRKQLEIWTEHCPENFENRTALVSAEIARLEGQPPHAMRLYDQAIRSARANGFVHNEAVAYEVAGRFYLGCGLEAAGLAHIREASACYAQWGADGKVKQLGRLYPQLAAHHAQAASAGSTVPQLDVATVAKASQAVSGEIELPKLIETLMKIALENAGADRGLLILPRGAGFDVEVEAQTSGSGVEVSLTHSPIARTKCSETIVNYVIRTQKSVIIDDASRPGEFFTDAYLRRGLARSVFCLPLLRQAKLVGVLYLENTRAAGALTADRIAVLDVLAAQAAISLENARLYGDLSESEANYSRIVNTAAEGIWVFDSDYRTTFVNASMARMAGYECGDMIGRSLSEFLFEEDVADQRQKAAHSRLGMTEHYERRFRHRDGYAVWTMVSASPVFDAGRNFQSTIMMLTDISERKRAEREMSLLNFAMNNVHEAAFLVDEHGRFRYVNDEACRKLHYEREELLSLRVPDIDPDFTAERWPSHWRELKEQRSLTFETCHKTKSGFIFPVEMNVNYIEYGNSRYNLALARDITERRRTEAELLRYKEHLEDTVQQRTTELMLARDAAEAANKAKSVFLANISHELRTPLNAILGFSSMMRRERGLNRSQCERLDIINRSGDHLLTLINDVLDIAKIEAGRAQLRISSFDLGAMVRDVAEMMQIRALEKRLWLRVDQSFAFPRHIKGDEARLRQVLVNLAGNAVKFTNEGGITIRLSVAKKDTRRLVMEVEDTGPGISAENQKRLFNPFVQVGEEGTQKGTGLGLAISRQFVELMGGSIGVASALGKGSIFRVEVPVETVSAAGIGTLEGAGPARELAGLAQAQLDYRILIAEDQRDNRVLLCELMAQIGLEVKIAENGKECVRLFEDWRPHLIWMDGRMPVMDGMEATQAIRGLPGGNDVKIVAVTASAFKEQQQEMLDAGMDDFVRKPYRAEEIYNCLAKQLGIQYLNEPAEAATGDQPKIEAAPGELITARLAALPAGLRQELAVALEILDSARIAAIISQIGQADAELGNLLRHLAGNFNYTAILNALTSEKMAG